MLHDTICAISTPAGVGGIAVARLSGPESKTIAESLLLSPKGRGASLKDHRVVHAHLVDGMEFVDDVVASYYAAPHSFTGDDIVEISCHGSVYVQQRVLLLLCANGARLAEPGEFTQRAFLNGKLNLSQAEAVADLIDSQSQASHRLAVSQLRGGYSEELESLRQQLVDMAALLELELDFSEEDLEFASRQHLDDLVARLTLRVRRLVESFAMGNAIKHGIPVAIVGRPNAGKSSLLNALLKEDRAIVSATPGTTRDTVEETLTIGGILFRFIDTAGLRISQDNIESEGIDRAYKAASRASVIIYVHDATLPPDSFAQGFDDFCNQCPIKDKIVVVVNNKSDLATVHQADAIAVSAKMGEGIEDLKKEILSRVDASLTGNEDAVLTNTRHYEAMLKVLSALEEVHKGIAANLTPDLLAIDLRDALYHLGTITGTVTSDEVLSSVFSRFCVGK